MTALTLLRLCLYLILVWDRRRTVRRQDAKFEAHHVEEIVVESYRRPWQHLKFYCDSVAIQCGPKMGRGIWRWMHLVSSPFNSASHCFFIYSSRVRGHQSYQ